MSDHKGLRQLSGTSIVSAINVCSWLPTSGFTSLDRQFLSDPDVRAFIRERRHLVGFFRLAVIGIAAAIPDMPMPFTGNRPYGMARPFLPGIGYDAGVR